MSNFCLSLGDILVNVNRRHDPFSIAKRWLMGLYEHVFIYMGQLILARAIQPSPYR